LEMKGVRRHRNAGQQQPQVQKQIPFGDDKQKRQTNWTERGKRDMGMTAGLTTDGGRVAASY